jgi:hypothetical protein
MKKSALLSLGLLLAVNMNALSFPGATTLKKYKKTALAVTSVAVASVAGCYFRKGIKAKGLATLRRLHVIKPATPASVSTPEAEIPTK